MEGEPIRETYQASDKLYAQLKADVKHRAAALDEAISKSSQVCLLFRVLNLKLSCLILLFMRVS